MKPPSQTIPSSANTNPAGRAYAVIMAGGSGTRFWPLSRKSRPKQLLDLFGPGTLLEQTVDRIRAIIPPERTYIFTHALLLKEVARLLPNVPREQIVAEPASRNTAPTVGLAAHEIAARDPEGMMVVLPADHVITKPVEFRRVLKTGLKFASVEGRSVLVGLKPRRPETGYGYIRLGAVSGELDGEKIFMVREFKEKPPFSAARRYVLSGSYLWNGGMFIWRASTVLRNFERCQPEMARTLASIQDQGGIRSSSTLKRLFPTLEKISIDYALMEKIKDIYAVAADIGWSDVGSWAVAYELNSKDGDGNVVPPNSFSLRSKGTLVVSPKKFVVTVGVENLVIVETEDALLVAARNSAQDVGKAVQELDRRGLKKLL
ncbi:MAG TPA: mannose-1-phosphate guanylyltransferase [Terriglobia bacterium]|nr:mannose-1-phosphate guanylyltransferase [Terriglobia bacterium]